MSLTYRHDVEVLVVEVEGLPAEAEELLPPWLHVLHVQLVQPVHVTAESVADVLLVQVVVVWLCKGKQI